MHGAIQQDLQAVREALSATKYRLLFAVAFLVVASVYAVLTNVVVLQLGELNPELDALNVALLAVIALLTALLVTLMVFKSASLGHRLEKKNLLGSLVGFFATACPVCQPIWLVWLGLGAQAVFLVEISKYVALASIALLLASVHFAAQNIANKTCAPAELKKHAHLAAKSA